MDIVLIIISFSLPFIRLIFTYFIKQAAHKVHEFEMKNLGLDMACVSIGFIYMIIDKQKEYIILFFFWMLFMAFLWICEIVYESNRKKKWTIYANFILAAMFIITPIYLIFPDAFGRGNIDPKFNDIIPSVERSDIKKICVAYLIDPTSTYNEKNLTQELSKYFDNKKNDDAVDIRSLFAACVAYKLSDIERTEKKLSEIDPTKFRNDKNFLLALIYADNDEKLSKLEISSDDTWLGIPQNEINKAKQQIDDAKNQIKTAQSEKQIKIKILDATGGKNQDIKKYTENAQKLKTYLVRLGYPMNTISVDRFKHELTPHVTNEYGSCYWYNSQNTQKDFDKLVEKIENYGQKNIRFQSSENLKQQFGGNDIVIVVGTYSQ